jgi:hypothetical protein
MAQDLLGECIWEWIPGTFGGVFLACHSGAQRGFQMGEVGHQVEVKYQQGQPDTLPGEKTVLAPGRQINERVFLKIQHLTADFQRAGALLNKEKTAVIAKALYRLGMKVDGVACIPDIRIQM